MSNARNLADLLAGGAFNSVGVDDNADATAITIDSSENVGLGTTTPATSLEISGTTANTQGGVFPRIQITTTADNNPTYSGSLDIVEKQSSATSSAVLGTAHVYGFRMMLDGFNNILKWFSASQTTVTERMGLDRDTGNLTLNTGNLIMGTSGKGIDFSATGDGSGTDSSELFDDYEEGTFTAGSAVGALNGSDIHYTKVGRMVHFHVKGAFSNSSNAEDVEITGLPYAPSFEQVAGSAMWRDLNTNFQGGVVYVKTNGRILFFDDGTTSVGHNLLRHNEIGSSNEVVLSGTYFTDS